MGEYPGVTIYKCAFMDGSRCARPIKPGKALPSKAQEKEVTDVEEVTVEGITVPKEVKVQIVFCNERASNNPSDLTCDKLELVKEVVTTIKLPAGCGVA